MSDPTTPTPHPDDAAFDTRTDLRPEQKAEVLVEALPWLEEFAGVARELPVTPHEWYQRWTVMTFAKWMEARVTSASPPHVGSTGFETGWQGGAP